LIKQSNVSYIMTYGSKKDYTGKATVKYLSVDAVRGDVEVWGGQEWASGEVRQVAVLDAREEPLGNGRGEEKGCGGVIESRERKGAFYRGYGGGVERDCQLR
jgi:hypothetical protein